MPRHPATLLGPPRLAAVTTVLAAGMVLPSMVISGSGQVTGGARPPASHPAAAKTVWAATASGRKVRVAPPKFIPTPVRPEKITHPRSDTMQIVTAAHGTWRHSVRLRLLADRRHKMKAFVLYVEHDIGPHCVSGDFGRGRARAA